MSDRNVLLSLLAIVAVLADIAATIEEILDNSGYTLGCAMNAALLAGLDPEMDYRKVPLIPADAVPRIRRRILGERAELAAMDDVWTGPRNRNQILDVLGADETHTEVLHAWQPLAESGMDAPFTVSLNRFDWRDRDGAPGEPLYDVTLTHGSSAIDLPAHLAAAIAERIMDAGNMAGRWQQRDDAACTLVGDVLTEARRDGTDVVQRLDELSAALTAPIVPAVQ